MNRHVVAVVSVVLVSVLAAGPSVASVDVPVTGTVLKIVDGSLLGKSRCIFVARDLGITKGSGTDPGSIASELVVEYDSQFGWFGNPPGVGWLVNKPVVAKYVNKSAPVGGGTKVSLIKPGVVLLNRARTPGDVPIDISTAPSGAVRVIFVVDNGGEIIRHCTEFDGPTCRHGPVLGGLGWKLVCRGNASPAACPP